MTAAERTSARQGRPQGRKTKSTASTRTRSQASTGTQTLLPPVPEQTLLPPALLTDASLLGYEPPARATRPTFRSEQVAPDFQVTMPGTDRIGVGAAPLLQALIEGGVTLRRPLAEDDTPLSVLGDLIRQEISGLDRGLSVIHIEVTEEERGGGLRLTLTHFNNWEIDTTRLVETLVELGQGDLLPSLLHHLAEVCSDQFRVYGSGSLGHDLAALFDYEPYKPEVPDHMQCGYNTEEALCTYTTLFAEKHDLDTEEEAETHPDFPAWLLGFGEWCVSQSLVNAATARRELPECVLKSQFLPVHEIRKEAGKLPAGLRRHFQALLGLMDTLRSEAARMPDETLYEKEACHGQDLGVGMPVLLVNQCVHVPLISALIDDAHENTMSVGDEEPMRTLCLKRAEDLPRAAGIIQGYARMLRALREAAHVLDWAEQDARNETLHKRTRAPALPALFTPGGMFQATVERLDPNEGHFQWSVPRQEKRMTTPTTSLLLPTSALVVYRHPGVDVPVVINHAVHVEGSSAILGTGTPVSREAMEALMTSLASFPLGLQAENVLAVSKDEMVFWERAKSWRFSFSTNQPDLNKLSGRMIPMPALVFKVSRNRGMQVFALGGNARPGPDTPLFAPPTLNSTQGTVCLGSTQLPDTLDPEHPERWSEAYFRSTFTHASNPMNWQGSYGDLLRLSVKKRRFPTEVLGKTVTTLRTLVEH